LACPREVPLSAGVHDDKCARVLQAQQEDRRPGTGPL